MKLNATFFIQIINFWATHWMLSTFLFKPFVDSINAKETAKNAELEALKAKELSVMLLEEEKQQQLAAFKVHINAHYSVQTAPAITLPNQIIYNHQPEKLTHLTQTIKNILIQSACTIVATSNKSTDEGN